MEENYCLRWERHNENFLKTIENFYKKTALIDVTVACEGKLYPAHKLVLSSCSDYFNFIFENTPPRENLIVVLNDISSKTLEYLLEFIYMGEINVKQNELSSLIRAAQYLKIKGLVANEICPSEYGAMHLNEHCNESYATVETAAIKIPAPKNSENAKSFLIEEPVQVMPEYPIIYSQVKLESVNKSGIAVNEHEETLMDTDNQHSNSESNLKRENSDKSPITGNTRGKKLKMLLQKKDDSSAENFGDGHTIFLPIEDESAVQNATSQVDLLQPIQEINYDKEADKEGGTANGDGSMIFTEIMGTEADLKHTDASSSQKGMSETLISTQNCSVVFEHPLPLQEEQNKMAMSSSVNVEHTMIVPQPQTSESTPTLKEDGRPRILKTSEIKKPSKPFRKYLCSECSYSSDFSSNVRRHIRTHTGEKPYRCPLCEITFASSGRFKTHMSKIHNA